MGHFNTPKLNRVEKFDKLIADYDEKERGRRKIDLVITSVLLDAGAGDAWTFADPETGEVVPRSEGLGLASYHLFVNGHLSSVDGDPLRAMVKHLISPFKP